MQQLISERQQYIDEFKGKNPSPYVGEIHYDHDGSLVRRVLDKQAEIIVSDPRFREKFFMFIRPEARNNTSKEFIEALLSSEYAMDALKGLFSHKDFHASEHGGLALQNLFDFGDEKSSDIYILRKAFEHLITFQTKKGLIQISPKDSLEMFLKHEYRHAKQNYEGMNLGEGLVIDSSNYHQISLYKPPIQQ